MMINQNMHVTLQLYDEDAVCGPEIQRIQNLAVDVKQEIRQKLVIFVSVDTIYKIYLSCDI